MSTTDTSTRADLEGPRALRLAFCLLGLGRPDEAEALYRLVLRTEPENIAALCGLGLVLERSGKAREAASVLSQAKAKGAADAHLLLGNMLCQLGSHDGAIAHYRESQAIDPHRAEIHNNLGVALQALGRFEEALPHHQRAAELQPELAQAQASLAKLHRILGRAEDAAEYYRKALALRPYDADLHADLAGVLQILGRGDEAEALCQRALAMAPGHATAHFNLALILHQKNDLPGAVDHYRQALAARPNFAESSNNLGNALQSLGRFDEAVAAYAKALAIKPDFADAHLNCGRAHQALGRDEDAATHFGRALAVDPSRASLHSDHAMALLAVGRLQEAREAFEQAARLAPENLRFQLNLASVKKIGPDDPLLAELERRAENEAALSEEDRICLNFALGKAYADLGRTDASFRHQIAGNRLKRRRVDYDEEATLGHFAQIRAIFTPELLDALREEGEQSPAPIFVVGMPRSGTTLIEQILASHSSVFGAGEISAFSRGVADLSSAPGAAFYPEVMRSLSPYQLRGLGEGYQEALERLAPGAKRVVDKMPSNFAYVGLIHLALPNARVVHARRNPVDTCLSCFSLLFTEDQPFTYDLGELGRYYRAYSTLMDHWRRVLPPGVMIDVQYETLVGDFENEARKLLAHCGLEWQEPCRAFNETRRSVHTASVAQVRRPLYTDSIGRWRPYAAHLQPLLEALEIAP